MILVSGHSKWATIHRKKGLLDAARGKMFQKLTKEIMVAAKGGSPDPAQNAALRLAVDKAILYGRNSVTTQKMPFGIMSRLAQTAQPAGYPVTARPWVDLHTSNIISISAGLSGAQLFEQIVLASGAAKSDYSRGEMVWVMNRKTYTKLVAKTVSVDAQGRVVSGVSDRMPVIGGIIEVLNFIPDNVIIAGNPAKIVKRNL